MELAEEKLDERVAETSKWHEEKLHSIKGEEEKLAVAKKEAAALPGKLSEWQAHLDAKERDLATREESFAA